MRIIPARRAERSESLDVFAYLEPLDEWLVELGQGEGPVRRGQVIDKVLDLRSAVQRIHELETTWARLDRRSPAAPHGGNQDAAASTEPEAPAPV